MSETIRARLKNETARLHVKAEVSLESPAKIETRQGLSNFLTCMLKTHVRFHGELDRAALQAGLEARSDTLISALAADLSCKPYRACGGEVADDAFCLGVGYVIEGSALGAGILRKRLLRADVIPPKYLMLLTESAKSRWPVYVNALDTGVSEEQSVLLGAKSAFQFIIDQAEKIA